MMSIIVNPRSQHARPRLWVPLALAIFFPASVIAEMWWTGVSFSTPMLVILGLWVVMTVALTVSLLRKRRNHLDSQKR
jgi:LPXTG-motif cell wall-anchored protein